VRGRRILFVVLAAIGIGGGALFVALRGGDRACRSDFDEWFELCFVQCQKASPPDSFDLARMRDVGTGPPLCICKGRKPSPSDRFSVASRCADRAVFLNGLRTEPSALAATCSGGRVVRIDLVDLESDGGVPDLCSLTKLSDASSN
jgi:hypothetical protein